MDRRVLLSLLGVVLGLQRMSGAVPANPVLRVTVDREAVYTPGGVRLTFQMTPAVRLAGPYDLRITVYVAQNKVREQTMAMTPSQTASYDLSFPRVHGITQSSYRVELSLGGKFLEALEGPIALWPPRDPPPVGPCGAEVWVLDTSGALQTLLPELGLRPADASFQSIRDFSDPDVIFVGEYVDSTSMGVLTQRIASPPKALVVIMLRQKQLPEEFDASIRKDTDPRYPIIQEPNSLLLKDLSVRDIMQLLDDSNAARVERCAERSIHSHLTFPKAHAKAIVSYLWVVEQTNCTLLFCQLPATARDDPRQMTLLRNLVQFACHKAYRADSNREARTERTKP